MRLCIDTGCSACFDDGMMASASELAAATGMNLPRSGLFRLALNLLRLAQLGLLVGEHDAHARHGGVAAARRAAVRLLPEGDARLAGAALAGRRARVAEGHVGLGQVEPGLGRGGGDAVGQRDGDAVGGVEALAVVARAARRDAHAVLERLGEQRLERQRDGAIDALLPCDEDRALHDRLADQDGDQRVGDLWVPHVLVERLRVLLGLLEHLAHSKNSTIFNCKIEGLVDKKVEVSQHCYGCTAGAGSSCQGTIA